MPIPILVFVVSATNRLLVPAAFWIWKAVAESAEFLNNAAPPFVKLATVMLLVSRFRPKLSLAPRVTAAPKVLPPCKMSPVPPTPAQLPVVRQTVPVALGKVMTLLEPAVSGAVIVVVKALVAFCRTSVPLVVLAVPTVTEAPLTAKVPVKLAADEIVWELMVEEVEIVVMPDKAPPELTSKPVEFNEKVSKASPMLMVSASALVAKERVLQAAELQMLTLVALVLPTARAPAAEVSTDGPCKATAEIKVSSVLSVSAAER